MKEAEWALRSSTEGEIAEERRRDRARRRFGWAFALGFLGLCPLSCLGALGTMFGGGPAAYGLAGIVGIAGLGVEYTRRSDRAVAYSRARQAALREEYADLHGWLVEVCVLQGAAPTGFDRGVLWFEDDRLMFVGERTSFALSAGQVRGKPRQAQRVRGLLSPTVIPLDARGPSGPSALGIDVVPNEWIPGLPYWGPESLQTALRGWALTSAPTADGQLPPLALGPESPGSTALLRRALVVSGTWLLLAALATALVVASGAGGVVMAAFATLILLACPDLWTLRLSWRAWRDRRRLEAYNRER